ncbi:hypothetical protein [Calidifontibacter indicus]|uniref:Uncharacterized protein n=1 Tax=Calidifontibacter indicus TaxID=419650 RepID=A0A3D9V1R4_9MICO|nr:hypothetical protein [Calidifontibacter indicus]REF32114.1 hypothetical protein DFJ65_3209 [Calidifontibacter indicus]
MRTSKRAAFAALALTTTIGLTACNSSDAPPADSTSSSAASSTDSSAPSESSNGSANNSSDSQSSSNSSSDSSQTSDGSSSSSNAADTTEQPADQRDDKNDKSALDAETSKIPTGPLISAKIIKLGGYANQYDKTFGTFYSVLSINASGRGLVAMEYVLLDASGKQVGAIKDNFEVAPGQNVIKVTRGLGKVPEGTKKVRLQVTKNSPNSYASVTEIDPNINIRMDPTTKSAVVSGRYKTDGKGSVISMNAVCSDANGVVQAANSPMKQLRAATWTPYEVKFLSAPLNYQPTKCYVGS